MEHVSAICSIGTKKDFEFVYPRSSLETYEIFYDAVDGMDGSTSIEKHIQPKPDKLSFFGTSRGQY